MDVCKNLKQREYAAWRRESAENFVLALLILLCCFLLWTRFCWLSYVEVSGNSMNDTLQSGDVLIVDRLANVKRGDVVVFTTDEYNGYTTSYIKRVIAVAGDEIKIENGKVFRKNAGETEFKVLNEPYAKGYTEAKNSPAGGETLKIADGKIFVMGDNRLVSHDSRAFGEVDLNCVDGTVPEISIKYRGVLNYFYGAKTAKKSA